MGKEILKKEHLAILKLKKINFTTIKVLFFKKDVDIEKVLVSNKISLREQKPISTLLDTCIMIIKLSHYILCFLKQALM